MTSKKNGKSSSFSNIVNDLSFVVTFIGVLIAVQQAIINIGDIKFKDWFFLIGIVLIFLIWFTSSIIRAQKSYVSPKKLPFPSSLWRLIFNNLPVEPREVLKKDTSTNILIIFDETTKSEKASIDKKYKDINLEIIPFSIDEKNEQNETWISKLQSELTRCDALLIFWTEKLKNEKYVQTLIENWSLINSHKAILAVNMIPDCAYELNYNTIPKNDIDSSLLRLLSRATERARAWRSQANSFRRIGISFAVILSVLFIFMGLKFDSIKTEKSALNNLEMTLNNEMNEIREKLKTNDLKYNDELWQSIYEHRRIISDVVNPYINKPRDEVIELIEKKLNDYFSEVSNSLNLDTQEVFGSFWVGRKYKESEDINEYKKTKIYKFSLKDDDSHTMDTNSILGCAFFLEDSFVLWKKETYLKEEDKASWKIDFENGNTDNSEVTGRWKKEKENGKDVWRIKFKYNTIMGKYKEADNPPKDRKGLLCLSINSPMTPISTSPKEIFMYGICIDSHLEPDFFTDYKTLQLMTKMACMVQILPESIINELLKRRQKKR